VNARVAEAGAYEDDGEQPFSDFSFEFGLARLLDKPAAVLALGKRAFYRQLEMGLEDAYAFTTEVIVDNALGRDFEEGLAAFVEKRPPNWDRC
jgi:enoyl-CoA hydratase/carnithine racemase